MQVHAGLKVLLQGLKLDLSGRVLARQLTPTAHWRLPGEEGTL